MRFRFAMLAVTVPGASGIEVTQHRVTQPVTSMISV
jgi:hypothetical protein